MLAAWILFSQQPLVIAPSIHCETSPFDSGISFTYKLADSAETMVWLTVNGVNDLPSVSDTSFWGYEDMPLVESWGVLLSNAYDADGMDGLQVELVGQATNGHVEISSYGSFVYTPNLNYWGPDSFTYRVFDGFEYSNLATATLTIYASNDPPVASDDTFALPEDEQCFTADVLVNDLDIDGDSLNVVLTSYSVPGQLWMLSGGYFQYIPPPNYVGQIQFTYQVTDFFGGMSSATVTLDISEVNDAPTANNDAYSIDEDNVLQVPGYLSVLANDEDIDFGGNPTSAQLVQWPTNGTLNFGADGEITYTPNANFNGTDEFTYQAVDIHYATSNTATVTITVYPVNDFPSVTDETYTLLEDEAQSGNVLTNDSDLEGNPLSATALDLPAHGSLTLDYSGNFTYTPAANYHGPDSFTYLVSDGWSQVMGTVTLTVTPVNDAPVAESDGNPESLWTYAHSYWTLTTDELVIGTGEGVLFNDSDPDNDTLTAILVDQPVHGFVALNPDGSFVYTPDGTYFGVVTFAYRAFDGSEESTIAFVDIAVNAFSLEYLDGTEWLTPIVATPIWAGESVSLRRIVEGPSREMIATKWTLTPTAILDFHADSSFGSVLQLSDEDRTLPRIDFYWITAGPKSAKVEITVGGKSFDKTLGFTVNKPTNTVSALTTGVHLFPGMIAETEWVQFGNTKNPARIFTHRGIEFTRNGAVPTRAGSFKWVQLIASDTRHSELDGPGGFIPYRRSTGGPVLDTVYPYPSATPTTTDDSPGDRLEPDWRTYERDDQFKMFLMWQSEKANSIPVPICFINWSWGATATSENGVLWALTPHPFPANPTSAPTDVYPAWVGNFEDFDWEHDD